tara:strand:+ start:220 stop:528 length:309 start_codon:yes stop_codon:yes gene_type:complete
MSTKCFKLTSGEELLAMVVSETDSTFEIENPAQIAIQPKEDGSVGLMIAQFFPYAEGLVTIFKSNICAIAIPAEALVEEYESKFKEPEPETRIQVPDRKIII